MIITDAVSSPVISNVLAAPSRFKIKASAKAFKILSGFYSEPILAIPRELGANAWDSHVKAGNTKQMFEVHAPNTLEPWFSVRDFGTGLSPENIDTIYTTYFESTKTADNDSDGCMGLGSKTPFNYTDNFSVTSFQNGKKYVYNCFIDETGSPNIMQIATVDTTEPNGLEVKFGIKIADIGMWVEKITRAYEPFRYRPIIKGANINYPERKYIYQGTGWAMRDNGNNYNRTSNAFMGNYCYPISNNVISNILYKEDKSYKYASLLSYGSFDFFFDIGGLEVAPNKEQLQYDDTNNKTANAIIAALKVARNELEDIVKKSIEVPKTRWEAMGLHLKYNGHGSPYTSVRQILGDIPITFNNERINDSGVQLYSSGMANKLVDKKNEPHTFQMYSLVGSASLKFKKSSTIHASYTNEVLVYFTNKDSVKKARVLHHAKSNNYIGKRNIFAFVDTSNGTKNINMLQTYFGWSNVQVINIESLPKPPPSSRQKRTASTDEILACDISNLIDFYADKNKSKQYAVVNSFKREASTFDSNTVYYYVDFLYSDAMWKDKNMSDYIDGSIKLFVKHNLQGSATKIYGINKKNANLLKVGTWINIFDTVKTKAIGANIKTFENDLYFANEYINSYMDHSLLSNVFTAHPSFIANIKSENTKKLFTDFVKSYAETSKKYSVVEKELLAMYGVIPKCHTPLSCDINNFKKLLKEKYMNVTSFLRGYDENTKAVGELINFIDAKS